MESLKGLVLESRTALLYQIFEERISLLEKAVNFLRCRAAKDLIPFVCNVIPH